MLLSTVCRSISKRLSSPLMGIILFVMIALMGLNLAAGQDNPPPVTNFTSAYVNGLADCSYQLIQFVCNTNGCSDYDPTQDIYSQCQVAEANLATADPCVALEPPDWTLGLHITAIFVVLVASFMGVGFPLLGKYHPGFAVDPYYIMLGKCIGIGIVLACSLVHMLQPAAESLTSPCVPWEFNTDYNAYAFLFCMLAALAMHFVDYSVETYLINLWTEQANASAVELASSKDASGKSTSVTIDPAKKAAEVPSTPPSTSASQPSEPISPTIASSPSADRTIISPSKPTSSMTDVAYLEKEKSLPTFNDKVDTQVHTHGHGHGHGGHVHSVLLVAGMKRTIAAYMLEFGVTVHSVFIGLENGIDGDDELHVLLVALVFHQMFEGIALGSRIADANMDSHLNEIFLATVFSIAAPLGIAVGVAVTTSLNSDGQTFLLVQGTFDGICAGILLYIGFVLLLKDFPEDMARHCTGKYAVHRKVGMFFALYLGAGMMAYIGKYL